MDLNKVYAYGLEKFAGNVEQAEEFVRGFCKEAGFMDLSKQVGDKDLSTSSFSTTGELTKGLMGGLGKGLGGLAVTGGVSLLGAGLSSLKNGALHTKFLTALSTAISRNPILRQAKKEKVMQYGETVFKFAPNVATDPNLLSSILANAVHGDGIDPMTIKTLTDLEGRFKENSGFNPKSYV